MTTDQAPPVARTSERGAATRSGLLTAAREVFTSVGYAQASVMEIVSRAGASVGSLYHHFSGKADLYGTLFEELHRDQAESTRLAVRRARGSRRFRSAAALLAGARGYLDCSWSSASCPRCSCAGMARPASTWYGGSGWSSGRAGTPSIFARSGEPLDEAVSIVMTGALMLAVAEISLSADTERARGIVEGVIQVLSRVKSASP